MPRGDPAQARLIPRPLEPRRCPERPGEAGRGDRRVPRGPPPQARPRRSPQQPRHCPERPGQAGRGDRRVPRSPTTQARLPRGPLQPRQHPESQGKLDEAIAEYRKAFRLKPDFAEAHCNLGNAFRQQGRFVEALAEFKRGHELGSKNPNWHYPSARVGARDRAAGRARPKLPAILAGKARPSDALETLGFAQLCYDKKLHGASARFWAEAFQAQPKLAEDMQAQNRYNAACAAALAGCGQGKDDPPLDDAAKARWRKQAIDWLKADLAAWSKVLESGPPQARQAISKTLQHWKADPDLAGIRDDAALAKLPADEQKACRAPLGTGRCAAGQERAEDRAMTIADPSRCRVAPGITPWGSHRSGRAR